MNYQSLTPFQGWRFIKKIWTIVVTHNTDYFVQPFSGRSRRLRCIFQEGGIDSEPDIFIHFTEAEESTFRGNFDPEVDLKHGYHEIYLYGAYNQINVCQMKVLCLVREFEPESEESGRIIRQMISNLEKVTEENFTLTPPGEAKEQALKLLKADKSGKIFSLRPVHYEYDEYQRG